MKLHTLVTVAIVMAVIIGTLSLSVHATNTTPQDSISYTMTTTTSYPVATSGSLNVNFNSVDLTQPPPATYSFGVTAKTVPGYYITKLHWQWGDGSILDVPYCCQSQISEVQNHGYATPGTYTVLVIAYDNGGNLGAAYVTVNWTTPIPEYPTYTLPLLISILFVLIGVATAKSGIKRINLPISTP